MKVNIKPLTDWVECRCGKGKFVIGYMGDNKDDESDRCIVHTVSYCSEFKDKEPVDFLQWHNEMQVN